MSVVSPDVIKQVNEATDKALRVLSGKSTIPMKTLALQVANDTGFGVNSVLSTVQSYVKNHADFVVRRGRNGGVMRRPVV